MPDPLMEDVRRAQEVADRVMEQQRRVDRRLRVGDLVELTEDLVPTCPRLVLVGPSEHYPDRLMLRCECGERHWGTGLHVESWQVKKRDNRIASVQIVTKAGVQIRFDIVDNEALSYMTGSAWEAAGELVTIPTKQGRVLFDRTEVAACFITEIGGDE